MSSKKKDEMLAEYDFRGKKGIRGKYYKSLKDGYQTIIHKTDSSTEIRETRPIFLEPELQKIFPTSESVNRALRELIEIKG